MPAILVVPTGGGNPVQVIGQFFKSSVWEILKFNIITALRTIQLYPASFVCGSGYHYLLFSLKSSAMPSSESSLTAGLQNYVRIFEKDSYRVGSGLGVLFAKIIQLSVKYHYYLIVKFIKIFLRQISYFKPKTAFLAEKYGNVLVGF